MMPLSYELKHAIAKHRGRFWCAADLAGLPAAPVYLFPDQERFDSDDVDTLAQRMVDGPQRLPHDEVLFEVTDSTPSPVCSQVAFARQADWGIEAYLILRSASARRWTDVLCYAALRPGAVADCETNPAIRSIEEFNQYATVLTGLVWRAVALLSNVATVSEIPFLKSRRPKLARAGVSGWNWRLIDIDRHRLRAAAPTRHGTHASPRWHIRRGHWRTLAGGRRIFVRACEVGNPAQGGVIKDYRLLHEVAS